MAEAADIKAEKQRLKQERKQLKQEEKAKKKEVKAKVRELEKQESEMEPEEAGGFSVALVTLFIVCIWIAIICLLIKLDVGGFGSSILYPILKDVPVVKEILPEVQEEFEEVDDEDPENQKGYGGYANIKEAVSYIKELELQIEQLQNNASSSEEYVTELEEEVKRLQTFEDQQVEFERIKDEFYKEVIYADNGPGADEYRKYYESINPELAEELYKQVVKQEEIDATMKDYVQAYTSMKPKEAAGIFEAMTDDLVLASQILKNMDSESRGKIMGVMDAEIAAQITKIMEP